MHAKKPPGKSSPTVTGGFQLDRYVILFIWRYLGIWQTGLVVLAVYLGFYLTTYCRFSEPAYVERMVAFAEVLTLEGDEDKPGLFKKRFDKLVKSHPSYRFHRPEKGAPPDLISLYDVKGPDGMMDKFEETAMVLAGSEVPSYDFKVAMRTITPLLKAWGPELAVNQGIGSRLGYDEYQFHGVDFGLPKGDLSMLREDAQLFLAHRDIFAKGANGESAVGFDNAPPEIKLMPWKLLKFSDEKRYQLNNELPIAFGTLLVVCSFLLQFRLIDREKVGGWAAVPLRSRAGSHWVPVWCTEGKDDGDSGLFKTRWLGVTMLVCMMLMLIIEFTLNKPRQRVEWIINMPIMMVVGAVMPLVWKVLWDLGKRKLNKGLAKYGDDFQKRVFRPFIVGCSGLIVVTIWTIAYSALGLMGSPLQLLRAVVQIGAGGFTLYLLFAVLRNISKELRTIDADRTGPCEAGESLNRTQSDIFDEFIPGLDDRAAQAALLILLPIPMLLEFFQK